jgi:outer membrane protein TolC
MTLSKTIVVSLVTFTLLQATTLKDIVESTLQKNDSIAVAKLRYEQSKSEESSVGNSFNPTINLGVSLTRLDLDTREVQVGTTFTKYAKVAANLYDGGRLSSSKEAKSYATEASKLSINSTERSTLLQVVSLYYQAKNMIDEIEVFKKKSQTLLAQYERVKTKYQLKMTTEDEVLKLKSEYETNEYLIEQFKYQKRELLANLSLLSGVQVENIEDVKLPNTEELEYKESENIEALKLQTKSAKANQKVISALKKPQLNIEDRLSYYNYDDYNEKMLSDLPEVQNALTLSLNYNLFDTTSSAKIQTAKIQTLVSSAQTSLVKKQEKMAFDLAKAKLHTQELKIASLKTALEMGESVYTIVKVKYENGIVDNIAYLDALSKKIYNEALYKESLNEYEIAKATYYFSSGVDYKKLINSWK